MVEVVPTSGMGGGGKAGTGSLGKSGRSVSRVLVNFE
jgi:hypothetical protein